MADIRVFTTGQLLELYALVLTLAGKADDALLAQLGFDRRALEVRLAAGGAVADAARLILLAGHTGNRDILALLIRGAMVERLGKAEKAAELRELATAAQRLPEWVFDLPESGAQAGSAGPAAESAARTEKQSGSDGTAVPAGSAGREAESDRRRRRANVPGNGTAAISPEEPPAAGRDPESTSAPACRDGPGLQ